MHDKKTTPREWQPMRMTHVGNVGAVMQKKSGPTFDPSPLSTHTDKRGRYSGPDRS